MMKQGNIWWRVVVHQIRLGDGTTQAGAHLKGKVTPWVACGTG